MQIEPQQPYRLKSSEIEVSAKELNDRLIDREFKSANIAHMFCADHMYKGEACRGEFAKNTLPVLLDAVKVLARKHPESQNLANLEQALEFSLLMSKDRSNYKKHFEKIPSLKANEFLAFTTSSRTHVIMFEIEKNMQKGYNFRLYDGTYVNYHYIKGEVDRVNLVGSLSMQNAVEFFDLSLDQFNEKTLEKLKDGHSSTSEMYKQLLPRFGQTFEGPSNNPRLWGSGQNGNCCSVFTPMLLAKSKLSKAEYQELKLVLRKAVYPFYASKRNPKDKNAHLINCIEAVKKICKGYQKLQLPLDKNILNELSRLQQAIVSPKNENLLGHFENSFSALFQCLENYDVYSAKRHLDNIYEGVVQNGEIILNENEISVILKFRDKLKKFAEGVMNEKSPAYHFLRESYDLLLGFKVLIKYSKIPGGLKKETDQLFSKLVDYFGVLPVESKCLRLNLYKSKENSSAWRRIFFSSDMFQKGLQAKMKKGEERIAEYRKLFPPKDSKGKRST